jgi:NitT/TauT family transport system permease protein
MESAAPAPDRVRENRLANIGLPLLTLFLLIVAWQVATMVFDTPSWMIPSPLLVIDMGIKWSDELPYHTAITLYETLAGYIVSILLGIPIAVAIVYSTILQRTIYPILLALQSVPKVALAPLLIMWVGHGELPKIIVVFLVCFFPIVVSATSGMRSVPPELLDLARSLSARPLKVFVKIRFPYALPHIFVGLKVAITLAVIGAVIGEFVGSSRGLGYLIVISSAQFNTALAFTSMFLLTAISIVLYYFIEWLERLIVPWAYRKAQS